MVMVEKNFSLYGNTIMDTPDVAEVYRNGAALHYHLGMRALSNEYSDTTTGILEMHQATRLIARAAIEERQYNSLAHNTPQHLEVTPATDGDILASVDREAMPMVTRKYFTQAVAFYNYAHENYVTTPDANAKDKDTAKEEWEQANVLMAEFAIDTLDLSLAEACRENIEDSAKKWGLVAKLHREGLPILAGVWQAPLMLEIEHGRASTVDVVSMHTAQASMALDRARLETGDDHETAIGEMRQAWNDTLVLLTAQKGKDLLPRYPEFDYAAGDRKAASHTYPAAMDVNHYVAQFAELFCQNGNFAEARHVLHQADKLKDEISWQDRSDAAADELHQIASSMQIRELCFGLTEAQVRQQAQKWCRDKTLGDYTKELVQAIVQPVDSMRYSTPSRAFLEQNYPGIHLTRYGNSGVLEEHRLNTALHTGSWVEALEYYDNETSALNYNKGHFTKKSPVQYVKNALMVAKYGKQIEESNVASKAHKDISAIELAVDEWRMRYAYLDTQSLPSERQKAIDGLSGFLEAKYGLWELRAEVFEAVLKAQEVIDPNTVKITERVGFYVSRQEALINAIPGYSQDATAHTQLHELQRNI